MKEIIKKWNKCSLIVRILIGLIIGAILGLVQIPGFAVVSIFGTVFVGALKAIAPVLVFVLVMSALANAGMGIGKRFRTVITLYMLSTLLAAIVAVAGSFIFPVTMKLTDADITDIPPQGIAEILRKLIGDMVQNPVSALTNANYIGILWWAIIFGFALKKLAKPETLTVIADFAEMVQQAVRWVIQLAPFGIMGLVYDTVSENGLSIFTDYGRLLALLVGCMATVVLVVSPLIILVYLKQNPYPLVFKCLKESGITAFFTRSSAANIPVNMSLCDKLGMDKDFYSVSIPLGATINMDGAAITITVMTLAVVHTIGMSVDIPTAILLSLLATISACGASGVAGGSLLLIPMSCSLFGISSDIAMQAVAVGFIIGVVQDSVETALNSSGDVMFSATAEFYDRMKRGEKIDLKKLSR
ncbi:MAG: serine/threonine transporter SstT [Dorea sp.]|nr:serine/threonine transporter SstT [Dorea sp.]